MSGRFCWYDRRDVKSLILFRGGGKTLEGWANDEEQEKGYEHDLRNDRTPLPPILGFRLLLLLLVIHPWHGSSCSLFTLVQENRARFLYVSRKKWYGLQGGVLTHSDTDSAWGG